ncbi:MAG: DUF234 domain-containing protein [Haloarculaceae archaeon]
MYQSVGRPTSTGYRHQVEPNLPDHGPITFEDVCREVVRELIHRGELGPYVEVSRWWYGGDEIDVVGLAPGDDLVLFGDRRTITGQQEDRSIRPTHATRLLSTRSIPTLPIL